MRYTTLFVIVLIGSYLFSCSGSKPPTNFVVKDGKYNFFFFDTANSKKCDGNLTLENAYPNKIFGKYNVVNRNQDTIPGFNYNKGYYEGTTTDKGNTIFLNMNPKIADANLFVNANVVGDSIVGTWNFSTLKGIQDRGIFKAGLIRE